MGALETASSLAGEVCDLRTDTAALRWLVETMRRALDDIVTQSERRGDDSPAVVNGRAVLDALEAP